MKLVKQEDDCGCTLACIATVTNRTYKDVKKDFEHDFKDKGQHFDKMLDYLGDAGFTLVHKNLFCYTNINRVRKEMLKPFAPVHIVHLRHYFDQESSHVVVMTDKGKILDPGGYFTDLDEVYTITDVIGLYK